MKRLTKAVFAALALTGSAIAISAPAEAQVSAYVGVGGPGYGAYYESDPYADPAYGDPYYGDPYYADPYDQAYADPYACDYYDPPWGYPPDYCAYQVWQEPIYVGGIWYSGPIYYRNFGGERLFWLNGGWRHDEWRGARPGRIDWGRNMRWSGPIHHQEFAGRGNWNGREGYRGGNFAGRNWNGGGNVNRGGDAFRGREFGARDFSGRDSGGRDAGRRDFAGRTNVPNFAAPQNRAQGGEVRGRFGGNFQGREFGGRAFAQPGVATNNGSLRGRFGGQTFQAGGPRAGGPRAGGFSGGGSHGESRGGQHEGGRHGAEANSH
jgi:hypothetical protein